MDARIENVLEVVANKIRASERFTWRELGQLVHLSASRLRHLFERECGTTLRRHVRNVRLQLASELLTNTRLSMKEVSARVGYSHPSSFSKQFCLAFGETPIQHRRRHSGDLFGN